MATYFNVIISCLQNICNNHLWTRPPALLQLENAPKFHAHLWWVSVSSYWDPSHGRISESRKSHNAAIQNVILVTSSLMLVSSPWSQDGAAKPSVNRLPRTCRWSWNTKHALNKHDWGWCWVIWSKSKSCTTKMEFNACLTNNICSSLSAITPNNLDPYNHRIQWLLVSFPKVLVCKYAMWK